MISDRPRQSLGSWVLLALSVGLLVVGAFLTVAGSVVTPTAIVRPTGSPVLVVPKSGSWLQSVSLVCGHLGDHPRWLPIVGRAVHCVGPRVVWSTLPASRGTVSAAGAAAVEAVCYAGAGHVVAHVDLRANGHGQWVGPAVWACPPELAPAPPSTTVLRAVGA